MTTTNPHPSVHYVAGSDRPVSTAVVVHQGGRVRPSGLDWDKHRAPDAAPTEAAFALAEAAAARLLERETALRATDPVPVPPAVQPAPAPPQRSLTTEVAAVAYTLLDTAGTDDVVVAACRAVVIAAGDALRGAQDRAQRAHVARVGVPAPTVDRPTRKGRPGRVKRRTFPPGKVPAARSRLARMGVTAAEVRWWAMNVGIVVQGRGAIAVPVLDAYEKAHPTDPS